MKNKKQKDIHVKMLLNYCKSRLHIFKIKKYENSIPTAFKSTFVSSVSIQ